MEPNEDGKFDLGEWTFVEKPLVGDLLQLTIGHGVEMYVVTGFHHIPTSPYLEKNKPNQAENMRQVRLLVKSVDGGEWYDDC